MKSICSSTFGWLGATSLTLAPVCASSNEVSVMGRLPLFMVKALNRPSVAVSQGPQAERTLALIAFQKGQRPQVNSWIQGLKLNNDLFIA